MEFEKLKGLWEYYKRGGSYEVLYRLSAYHYLPKPVLFLAHKEILALGAINAQSVRRALPDYEFARAGLESIDALLACQGEHAYTPRSVFERFFREGRRCFVVRKDGRVVAYFWAFEHEYTLEFDGVATPLTLRLDPDQLFFGNGFIAPAYRLRGLFPYMLKYVTEQYPASTRYYSAVDGLNLQSLKAHNRFGFVSAFRVTCIGVLNARFFYRSEGGSRFAVFLGTHPQLSLSHCLLPPADPVLDS